MNVKPGDLAVIVADDFPENVGRFVRVLHAATDPDYQFPIPVPERGGHAWEVEALQPIKVWQPEFAVGMTEPGDWFAAEDSDLRPWRGQLSQDEVQRIAGKPQFIKTPEAA